MDKSCTFQQNNYIYESLLENTHVHLAYFDNDFNFLFVNPVYASHRRTTPERLMGRNHFDVFPDEEIRRIFEYARDNGVSVEFKAKPYCFSDKSQRIISYWDGILTPIKDTLGSVRGLTLSLTDVTECVKTEQRMKETYADLKRAEKELNAQNNLLQVILNQAHSCILVLKGHELRCTLVNTYVEKIMGSKQSLLGKSYQEIFPESVARGDEAELRCTLETGRPWQIKNPFFYIQEKRWDGYAVRLPLIPDEPPSVLIVLHDTTEIWKTQEVYQKIVKETVEQQSRLLATISSIAAGVIIYDNQGNIIEMNHTASEFLHYSAQNYPPSLLERWNALKIYKADGTPYLQEENPLYRALKGEIVRDEEAVVYRNPDKPTYFSATIAPITDRDLNQYGVVFIFTDITERKRKEADLLASERELLKISLNSLGEGVIATDSEGQIFFINHSALNIVGYLEDEALGKPISRVFYVMDDKTSEPVVVGAGQPDIPKLILVTRELKEITISLSTSPIKMGDGRIIGTVVIFQDITNQQKIEQELLKTEKLESLGILAGGIAHDFNNILAALLANIQLITVKIKRNEDVGDYLLNTERIARKASELTKQLLTFSKGGAPVRKNASLIDLIKDTAEFILRGSKIKAEFEIPEDLWEASVDEGQISQVLQNLVLNAKQAMPRGGIIKINATNTVIGNGSHLRPGNYVKITFTDCGVGISRENLTKIFDPFFTTKKDGNGLGLATSYSIIAQHDGYIEVDSTEGKGTSFMVYLPASNTLPTGNKTREREFLAGSSFKILLMDDEVAILTAMQEMLEYYGHHIALARDGAEAIALYKQAYELGEAFDIIIMDLTIPGGMGGQETIAHLRDFDPKVKAIVSSGYANDPVMAEYERYGFCGVVSKPYKIDELIEVLYQVACPNQLRLGMIFE